MRILIDPSSGHCLNLGDVAMLQVTFRRLRAFWPDAEIHVFTENPELLEVYCPSAIPLPFSGRQAYYTTAAFLTRLGRRWSSPRLSEFDVWWRQRWPKAAAKLVAARNVAPDVTAARNYLALLRTCDLVVASGAGQITTSFAAHSTLILNTLEYALQQGIPTVLFGQGIGPIDEPCLRVRAEAVLRRVDLVCLRETVTGPKLLDTLGVPREKILVTGDDAIDPAYSRRRQQLGNAIGVNLRISWYSDISKSLLASVRRPLQEAARALGAPLLSVPISRHPDEDDPSVCRFLLDGYEAVEEPAFDLESVEGIVDEIGRCRVVITTSYHGGVLALAQGIPVVAWINSKYFAAKLYGLANQFGVGCEVVALDEGNVEERLKSSILSAWNTAENVRPHLLQAAAAQLAASKGAYERLRREVVDRPRPPNA
jgi:polysaccharide pyruvyl transferase WcaK-like protein